MDQRDALLAALHADPADDVAWLALADWLDENGQNQRAELLRLHHSLPHLRPGKNRRAVEERIQGMLASGVRPCVPVLTNSIGMRLALIPAGAFRMGSPRGEVLRTHEEPLHDVRITRPFYLGVYLVTQAEYRDVTRRNPRQFRIRGLAGGTDRYPVESVSWVDAVAFCAKLSARREEKKAKRVYRLPTEAEWEYACRAWGSPEFPFHLGKTLGAGQANFNSIIPYPPKDQTKLGGPSLDQPCDVGCYAPNAFGLYDVHGNVDEWVSDYFDEDYYPNSPQDDPPGPEDGGEGRVVRGGSWGGRGSDCRAAVRLGRGEEEAMDEVGFRVAMTLL